MPKSTLVFISLLLFLQVACSTRYVVKEDSDELVVLLHGIKDKPYTMWKLGKGLGEAGYSVINIHYPSVGADMDSILQVTRSRIQPQTKAYEKIYFVTHSLGGIVARAYLKRYSHPAYSRIVMIAPPNRGAIMAERLEDFFFYKW